MPRLEAVRPLPSEEATPPVTKICLLVRAVGAKSFSRGLVARPAMWCVAGERTRNRAIHGIPQ